MALLTRQIVTWIIIIVFLMLFLTFIALKFGAESPFKTALLDMLQG